MGDLVKFCFRKLGSLFKVTSPKGLSLLEVAHKNKIELEGACEGSLACSTCHVILDKDLYDRLGEASDKEFDLLDQAYGLRSTSRLGCQVQVGDLLEGKVVDIPGATRNMAVDGYKPPIH